MSIFQLIVAQSADERFDYLFLVVAIAVPAGYLLIYFSFTLLTDQIGFALFLLWQLLGPSALAGMAVICIMIPVTKTVAKVGSRQTFVHKSTSSFCRGCLRNGLVSACGNILPGLLTFFPNRVVHGWFATQCDE